MNTRRATQFTSHPDPFAPQLFCPTCERQLVYRQTVISGVPIVERWDYFECRMCGPFQYRHRTRQLRSTTGGVPITGGIEATYPPASGAEE